MSTSLEGCNSSLGGVPRDFPLFLPSRRTRDYNDYLTREPVSWDGRERRGEGKRKFVKRVFRSWKDFIFGENLSQKDIYLLFCFFIRSFFFFLE